jgi:ABC-type transport system substrate-binding protein
MSALLMSTAPLRSFTKFSLSSVENLRKILPFFAFVLAFWAGAARGQQSLNFQERALTARSLVIGLLNGKTDYRDVTITLRDGTFRIYGQGNSKPFEMIEGDPERIIIAFRSQAPNVAESRPQRMIYQFFRTERSLISAIILDEIDYTILESEASAEEIQKATRKYRIVPIRANPNTVEMVCYNLAHPILRERTVRQALSYAIRREEIKRRFSATRSETAKGPFPSESQFFPPNVNEYDYNPKKALALLGSAGWRDSNHDQILDRNGEPLRFRLFYDQSTQVKDQIVRQIKINWNEIGIDVIPMPLSANEINDLLRSGSYDAVLAGHIFEETLASLDEFFNPGFLRYDSPRLQQVFSNAAKFQGTPTFRPYIQRLQIIINEDQPVSFLYHPWVTWHVINNAKFENFFDRSGGLKPPQEWELRLRP